MGSLLSVAPKEEGENFSTPNEKAERQEKVGVSNFVEQTTAKLHETPSSLQSVSLFNSDTKNSNEDTPFASGSDQPPTAPCWCDYEFTAPCISQQNRYKTLNSLKKFAFYVVVLVILIVL